jgi:beta-lactamase class A
VLVRADGRTLAVRRVRGGRFDFYVDLPMREMTLRIASCGPAGCSSVSVARVVGLPHAARPKAVHSRLQPSLSRRLRELLQAFPGVSATYVQDLETGNGAAWNARARFPAASTLKLAIAVAVLRELSAKPSAGSTMDRLLQAMLDYSSNEAANALEVYLGGSTIAGGTRVNELMRSLGMVDSDMYGGYLRGTAAHTRRPIPRNADVQPSFGLGKYTTAFDLTRLLTLVHLATEGRGLLARRYRGQFTPADARYLLYTLAHVRDGGKLGRFLGGSATLLHKAGWITEARHDAGLVYWRGGVFVVAVMTYGRGVGVASDVLAGRVAHTALTVFGARQRRGVRSLLRRRQAFCQGSAAHFRPASAVRSRLVALQRPVWTRPVQPLWAR